MLAALIVALCAGGSLAFSHVHESDLSKIKVKNIKVALNAAATLTLNVSDAITDGAYIQISVDNPAFAPSGDWLGVYPAAASLTESTPLKWTYMNPYIPGYNVSGKGVAVFQVYLVRTDQVFALFSGGSSNPVLIAQSVPVRFVDNSAPVRPRLLPGASGAAGDYAIAWTTTMSAASPALKWGTAPGVYTNKVAGTAATLAQADLCGAPANAEGFLDLGATVTAQLPGIGAQHEGATIYYQLTDGDGRASQEFAFAVPAQLGTPDWYPFNFVAFGDLGRGSFDDGVTWREYGQPARTTALLLADDTKRADGPEFIHHFGDLSYAVGYLQTWDEYVHMISGFTSRSLYLVGVGNHESDFPDSASWAYYGAAKDSGGECTLATNMLFPLPAPATAARPYYAYASGPVTLVVLSSEHDFSTGSAQLLWLEATLAAVNRTATPFLIVSSHRPMYVDSNFGAAVPTGDVMVMNLLQQYVEPITHKYKVTLMLYGHNHRLERISAAYQNRTVLASVPVTNGDGEVVHTFVHPGASVHYLAGTAGANYTPNDCVSTGTGECPEWSESVVYEHGYLRFSALNETALSFDYVASVNNTVIDRVLIVQDLAAPWA